MLKIDYEILAKEYVALKSNQTFHCLCNTLFISAHPAIALLRPGVSSGAENSRGHSTLLCYTCSELCRQFTIESPPPPRLGLGWGLLPT